MNHEAIQKTFPIYPITVIGNRIIVVSSSFDSLEYPDRIGLVKQLTGVDDSVDLVLMTPSEAKFLTLEGGNTAQMIWNPQNGGT